MNCSNTSETPDVPFRRGMGETENGQVRDGRSPDRKPRMKNLKHYLAHVRRNEDRSEIHHLEEHLRAVADLAGEFASAFGYSEKVGGKMTGCRHDKTL